MKKILSPLALISAAALVVAACSTETPTGPSRALALRADVGIAAAGTAQVCLDAASPGGKTYQLDLVYGGDNTGDTFNPTPQAMNPGDCIDADVKNPSDVGPSFPIATVLSTMSVNEVGGSWTWTCVVSPDSPTFCPDGASGSDNDVNSAVSLAHGTSVTFTYVPPSHGCGYSQGFYKNHQSSVSSILGSPVVGTFISGGELDIGGGITLTASEIVSSLKPSNASAPVRQLITAELNVTKGAATTSAIDDAIAGIRAYNGGTPTTKSQLNAWSNLLDAFNNGNVLGAAPHCGDETV